MKVGGMVRLGLTGGIGSGKSTVARLFEQHGAVLIDADAISRQLTAVGGKAIKPIADIFGVQYITSDGALDRTLMRQASFTDNAIRTKLEAIIHPLVGEESARLASDAVGKNAQCIVFDIPLLVESRTWRQRVDRVLVVDCVEEVQIQRVMDRNGMTREEVMKIIESQATRLERLRAADLVIFNAGPSLTQIALEVQQIARCFGL